MSWISFPGIPFSPSLQSLLKQMDVLYLPGGWDHLLALLPGLAAGGTFPAGFLCLPTPSMPPKQVGRPSS